MAVVVQCFHCSAILELDEGFRGGVCKCKECGSLLQVPKAEGRLREKKVRPAKPPMEGINGMQGSGGSGAVEGTAISSGGFDPRSEGVDAGGLSSGLAGAVGPGGRPRIHKTRPITATPKRKRRREEGMEAATGGPPPLTPVEGFEAAELPTPELVVEEKRGWFWLGVAMVLLVAAAIIVWLVWSVLHGDGTPR